MPEAQPAATVSLSFAKLVATPTEKAWSQAYNAGNLFVCLSLSAEEANEELSLHVLGKDLFSVLQSEFFTLQEKNTETIKKAISTSLETVPQDVTSCLTLAFFKDTVLYVFIAGSGKIVMKRGEKVGTLLARQQAEDLTISSASGFMQNTDTIILETGQFAEGISEETVTQALELALPNDIVEALSPQIHKQDNGAQAAIVIACHGTLSATHTTLLAPEEEQREEQVEDPTLASLYATETTEEAEHTEKIPEPDEYEEHKQKRPSLKLPKFPKLTFHLGFNHRRKLFLNIALILAVLLTLSIFFTVKKYNDDKQQALFHSVYPTAQQYYSEGQGLATVNASLSQDSYHKAETLLKDNGQKFSKGSQYEQQITDLLAKVESGLQGNTSGQQTNATSVPPQPHSLLAVEEATNGLAFGQDDTDIYVITDKTVATVSKSDGTTKNIIKNNNDWVSPVAIVPYEGNVYILDQKKGVLKFVPAAGGFGKSSYFSGNAPDLSQAAGMAIDGSVWIVLKDGTIMEYTKGKSNNLNVSGLTKPLSNPTKIITDITMENVYVLDAGNSRIVQFDKNGKYQNAYSASIIINAKDIEVSEKDKTIQILTGGKVFQVSM